MRPPHNIIEGHYLLYPIIIFPLSPPCINIPLAQAPYSPGSIHSALADTVTLGTGAGTGPGAHHPTHHHHHHAMLSGLAPTRHTKPHGGGGGEGGGSVNDDNQSVGNQSVQSMRSLVSVGGLIDKLKGGQGTGLGSGPGQGDNRMGGMASPMTFNDSETLTHQPTPHHPHHHHATSPHAPLGELIQPGDEGMVHDMGGRPMTDQLDSPGRDLFDRNQEAFHGSFQVR